MEGGRNSGRKREGWRAVETVVERGKEGWRAVETMVERGKEGGR